MDGPWLKAQFEHNPDKSKADLARALNLEPPAISKILNGTRQIKAPEYQAMRRYFGLPVDGEHAVSPDKSYRLETLAGTENSLREDDNALDEDSWTIPASVMNQRTQTPPENVKIFTVQETVMEPDYKRGEQVVVDLSETTPSPPGAFILHDGFGYMLRLCEFVPKSDPPDIKISAPGQGFQTQTLPQSDIEIIGRVIAKLQWL